MLGQGLGSIQEETRAAYHWRQQHVAVLARMSALVGYFCLLPESSPHPAQPVDIPQMDHQLPVEPVTTQDASQAVASKPYYLLVGRDMEMVCMISTLMCIE